MRASGIAQAVICVHACGLPCLQARAVKRLLAHRLPAYDTLAAKQEWYAIVEGQHTLWQVSAVDGCGSVGVVLADIVGDLHVQQHTVQHAAKHSTASNPPYDHAGMM